MKVYRELSIKGTPDRLERLPTSLEAHATPEWRRDRETEERLGRASLKPMFCFAWAGSEARPASFLWLTYRSAEELYVANIVPREVRQLSREQYNDILEHFSTTWLAPVANDIGVELQLGPPDLGLDHWLTPTAIDLLRFFSRAANRSTGSAHPNDRDRWLAFIFAAHREGSTLPNDMLRAWLIEEEGWSQEKAYELSSEYETALEILKAYDRSRAGGNG